MCGAKKHSHRKTTLLPSVNHLHIGYGMESRSLCYPELLLLDAKGGIANGVSPEVGCYRGNKKHAQLRGALGDVTQSFLTYGRSSPATSHTE